MTDTHTFTDKYKVGENSADPARPLLDFFSGRDRRHITDTLYEQARCMSVGERQFLSSTKTSATLKMHDFAGQDKYGVLQTLFISPYAVYVVMFNLRAFLPPHDRLRAGIKYDGSLRGRIDISMWVVSENIVFMSI